MVLNRALGVFLLGTTALVGALAPTLVVAQDIELDTIVIAGDSDDGLAATGPVNGYVAKRTTTGSKTSTPLNLVPQSVSVIGRAQIEDRGATKADEALRYTAGVFAQPFGSDSDMNWLFIRGFQATQSGTYQDGLQNYSYAFGSLFIDSYNIERIEVLRGAASVLYGGANPGGIVNYVTKKPTGENKRTWETGIDQHGTAFAGVDIDQKLTDTVDARVVARIQGGKGYTDFAEGFRGTISPSVTFKPTEQTKLTVLANYTHVDETHNGGAFLPYYGTVVPTTFGTIPRTANFTEEGVDTYERQQFSIGYELEHEINPDWKVRSNARYGYADIHEHQVYANAYPQLVPGAPWFSATPTDPTNQLARVNFEHQSYLSTFLMDNQVEGKIRTGAVEQTLLFGVDYRYFRLDQTQAVGSVTTISANNPVFGAPQGPMFAPYIDNVSTINQIGLYAQDQVRFGNGFLVTLNGRYDHVWTEVTGTNAYSGDDGAFTGRIGLAYEFDNGITPYASVANFYNPTIGSNATIGAFKPETGVQYEVGVKYEPTWFDGMFTLAFFDLTKENVLTGSGINETQLGEVNSRGFEAELQANITEELKATAALTMYDIEIVHDYDAALIGNVPVTVPEQQASLALDYTFGDGPLSGVTLGGGVRYVGSSWADKANTLEVPDSTVFDAKIGYETESWGVDLNVTNIFDHKYVAACQEANACYYGEGRTAKLRLHGSF